MAAFLLAKLVSISTIKGKLIAKGGECDGKARSGLQITDYKRF